jgi:hypothetical protein
MNRRKWVLLVLVILLAAGYLKLCYKTWSEKAVPASADCLVVLDVKRVTNTLLWQFITSPGQWKPGNIFRKKTSKELSWRDMVSLPDYVFGFHVKGHPPGNWFALLNIKSKTKFEEGLKQFAFESINKQEYVSAEKGIYLFVQDNELLVGKALAADSMKMRQVAKELFTAHTFIPKPTLEKAIAAKSHLAVYLAPGDFLKEPAIITANFNKNEIKVSGALSPLKQYTFSDEIFTYDARSVFAAGFSQPSPVLYKLLPVAEKERISKAINLQLDSVILPGNASYNLQLQELKEKIDSAITYTYDDEFNKVEKLTVNRIQEPSFIFSIKGKNTNILYRYLQQDNKLEQAAAGDVFLPMPLVKTYCTRQADSLLALTAYNFSPSAPTEKKQAVFFFHSSPENIPADQWRYFPANITSALSNMALIELTAVKKGEQILIYGACIKKKNDKPLIGL